MRIASLLCLAFLGFSGNASAETKRYIVGFVDGVGEAEKADLFERFDLKEVDSIPDLGAAIVETLPGSFAVRAFDLMADRRVLAAEEDVYINWLNFQGAAQPLPVLPNFDAVMNVLQRRLEDTAEAAVEAPVRAAGDPHPSASPETLWGISRVGAAKAWPVTAGRGVRVAVIDTGIDATHPDLAANVAGGYDATGDGSWADDQGHGTHVAGTIAAVKDGKGVVGVAPAAKLFGVKVLDKDGSGRLSWIVKGALWAAKNDIDVANMSLGAPIGSVFMRGAMWYARTKGVVIVAAAGNSGGKVGFPAAYGDTLAIAASDSSDKIASFSSRGKEVDFIAPGVDIYSTVPGGGYASYRGTSMATPHVSGLAALAVARGAQGLDAVKAALTRAASPLPGLSSDEQGVGMIDAERLIRR